MATFTAYAQIDARTLDLYQFYKSAVIIPDSANGGKGGFTAKFGPNSYVKVTGQDFAYTTYPFIGTVPTKGTTTAASVYIDGTLSYALTGIAITQAQAQAYLGMKPAEVSNAIFAGSDTIIGSAKGDVLSGFAGADVMRGNGGNDTYLVDNVGDKVFEKAGEGKKDTVLTSVDFAIKAGQEIEILATTDAKATTALKLSASADNLANTITGNDGDNRIDGGGGADVMIGRKGSDLYIVDNAADQVIEVNGKVDGIDSILTTVSYTLKAGVAVEQLFATNRASTDKIDLTGNEFASIIKGTQGDNVIDGGGKSALGAGADVLVGFGGKDTFVFSSALLDAKGKVIADNVGHISDFNVADDAIRLAKSIFAGLTADAKGVLVADQFKDIGKAGATVDATDRILYDSKSGALYYDRDGSATKYDKIKFAVLDNHKALVDSHGVSTVSHADILLG